MPALVTVAQVNAALRLNLEADVGDLSNPIGDTTRLDDVTLKIAQATDIVLDYIKLTETDWTSDTVPGRVSASIIVVVRCLLDDDQDSQQILNGLSGAAVDLGNPVVAMLYRLRDPALA